MQITLTNTGKRYNREWIFRHVSYDFISGRSYAITGPNGSGKSTLLQVIAGSVLQSEGEISYYDSGLHKTGKNSLDDSIRFHQPSQNLINGGDAYQYISIATPYLELIEEMTAGELLSFHATFKEFTLPQNEMLEAVGLENAADKQIRYYSSGMKQRLKMAQAFFSNTPVLLLDEPTTNLDADGILLYKKLISHQINNRVVIISSNVEQEYDFCTEIISIGNYKQP